MMQRVQHSFSLTAAALAAGFATPAHAAGIDEMVGRWGGNGSFYDCAAADGTETQAVTVEKSGEGFYAGAYVWGCTVKSPKPHGAMIGGDASCASEGDGETSGGHIELGMTAGGQLVLADESSVNVFDPCPARQ